MDLFGEDPANTPEPDLPAEGVDLSDQDVPAAAQGLGHPREMTFSLGHEAVEQKLLEAFNVGRMPHGLIFAGQKGIGKATMAYRLARFMLKNGVGDSTQDSLLGDTPMEARNLDVDPEDGVFRRVLSGGHADFMSVERPYDSSKNRYQNSVPVAEIRKVPGFLRMTASDGGWRVVIIDDADTMNRSAQNALLKILEEPPKNALMILVTHRLGALIPTIRSRAQVLHFQPLSNGHIESLLKKQGIDPADIEALSSLSEGSVGKALHYAQEGGLESLQEIFDLLQDYPQWDWPKIHALGDRLGTAAQTQAYENFKDLLQWLFSQMVVAKARGETLSGDILGHQSLQSFMRNSSLEKLLKICENLHTHFLKVDGANLDKRQGILRVFEIIAA